MAIADSDFQRNSQTCQIVVVELVGQGDQDL
jgi:hypothetical protein